MLKGYTAPRTPKGTSSLAPMPPWHYVGTCLAVEYEADPKAVESFLPPGLDFHSPRCAVYFADWQYASESGEEYLDPVRSQYRETIFLVSASYEGTPYAYCPFIWVDQDVALMRGFAQGWPKQIGSTWITRSYDLSSKAAPVVGPGGKFGATLAVKDRRLVEAVVTLREQTTQMPSPGFAGAVNVRHFPELVAGRHDSPAVHELVNSSPVMSISRPSGKARPRLRFLIILTWSSLTCPANVIAGYRFTCAMTVDDLVFIRDLKIE